MILSVLKNYNHLCDGSCDEPQVCHKDLLVVISVIFALSEVNLSPYSRSNYSQFTTILFGLCLVLTFD